MTEASPNAFAVAAQHVSRGADAVGEATALVAQMTLDEKLSCLDGDTPFWPGLIDMTSGGYHRHPWPAAEVERLGIPGIQFSDGPRGCVIDAATCFPVSMARGATFDPDLEERIGHAIGEELRAVGATYTGAVCMNLLRHPAWGRAQETYGEDPHHVGELARALTIGLQGHVMACMKHFALNSMENARFSVDVTVSERALHEVYLPHFRRVAEAGVASVMSAYNSVNGEWCGENKTLLVDILRTEWGWHGFVTSDFIFGLRDAAKSVQAGLNIEMPFRQQREMHLREALSANELDEVTVDRRVIETVATLLRFAYVFDAPRTPKHEILACSDHRELARDAASKSMVLLQNDSLLPLQTATLRRVAFLGRLAAVPNLGDGGSSNVLPPSTVTPLDGFRDAVPSCEVMHSDNDISIVDGADAVIVVVGYTKHDEGEWLDQGGTAQLASLFPPTDHPTLGFAVPKSTPTVSESSRTPGDNADQFTSGGDRASLRLSDEDEALIAAVSQRHSRVIVAVMSGSAVVMPWLNTVGATLMIWYPGMEGGHALADVLLGTVEPGGRLPFAMPTDESQLVHFDRNATTETYDLLHGQWWLDHNGHVAHRPFGFGLGYTSFTLSSAQRIGDMVQVTVANVGSRTGSTVVQVYASVPNSTYLRPKKRLVGFRRVTLDAGHDTTVSIVCDLRALDIRENGSWTTEPCEIALTVGQDAGPDQLSIEA